MMVVAVLLWGCVDLWLCHHLDFNHDHGPLSTTGTNAEQDGRTSSSQKDQSFGIIPRRNLNARAFLATYADGTPSTLTVPGLMMTSNEFFSEQKALLAMGKGV